MRPFQFEISNDMIHRSGRAACPPVTIPRGRHWRASHQWHTHHIARQRGSVYLIVLGACMMVAVLGVGSLLAVRVERRMAQSDGDAVAAGFYARSAIDAALLDMAGDPDWRTTYKDDLYPNWTTPKTFGDGALTRSACFAFLDEDGSLTDDPTDFVWLYGRGQCGSAVRMMRVRLVPEYGLSGSNLVNRAELDLIKSDDDRTFSAPATFVKGEPCRLDAWVRTTSGSAENVRLILELTTNGTYDGSVGATITPLAGGTSYQKIVANTKTVVGILGISVTSRVGTTLEAGVKAETVDTNWTHLAAIVTPTWSGTLQNPPPSGWDEGERSSPAWKIKATLSSSGSGSMGELEVRDDVRLVPANAMYQMTPVAGTWEPVVE